jgi:hypothetical protein
MKRTFGRFTTTIILGMILALMMATMASAAIPQTIFYTNAAGQIVEANYQMAIEAYKVVTYTYPKCSFIHTIYLLDIGSSFPS